MAFNSINYLLFFFASALVYYAIPHRFRWAWIVLASLFFYASFIPVFVLLIAGLIPLNYLIAIRLSKMEPPRKNRLFLKAVLINIFILAFFKFFNFFHGTFNAEVFKWKVFSMDEPMPHWVIPLGLSYFTFTVLSYLIEVKRGRVAPEHHLGIFSAYLLFFPKIAQGPIEKPQNLIPQFHLPHPYDFERMVNGMKMMLWGYFKKLVVADRLALYVNAVFDNSANHGGITLAVATIFYAFQIYADFSGYTDIALGSADILGFRISQNFKQPYLSASVKDFWNRWHITFSTWLRDYLFLPLAYFFSKKLKKPAYLKIPSEKWIYLFAVAITFALAGIWHGEGLNYLAWGSLFGFYLACSHWSEKSKRKFRKWVLVSKLSACYKICKIVMTFFLVSFAWIFFRAPDLSSAMAIVAKIFTRPGTLFLRAGDEQHFIYGLAAIAFLMIIDLSREYGSHGESIFKSDFWFREQLFYVMLVFLILLVGVLDGGQFIYFQF